MEGWLLCLHVVVRIQEDHPQPEKVPLPPTPTWLSSQWAGGEAPSPAMRAWRVRGAPRVRGALHPALVALCGRLARLLQRGHWGEQKSHQERVSLQPSPRLGPTAGPFPALPLKTTFSRAIRQRAPARLRWKAGDFSPVLSAWTHLQQGHQTGLPSTAAAATGASRELQLVASGDNHHSPHPTPDPFVQWLPVICSPLGDRIALHSAFGSSPLCSVASCYLLTSG